VIKYRKISALRFDGNYGVSVGFQTNSPQGCCKFPSLADDVGMKVMEQLKDQKLAPFMMECVSFDSKLISSFTEMIVGYRKQQKEF
jgi:hypothetical protein